MKKKLSIILLLLAIFSLIFGLISKKVLHSDSSLTLVFNHKIKSFDPAVAFNDDSLLLLGQSLETLYQYHYLKRPFEVIPSLAEDMPHISRDGRTYTIKIKKGIKYHKGNKELQIKRDLNAQDFIWQIKRLAFNPIQSTGKWLFEGKIKGFDEFSKEVGSDFDKFLTHELSGVKAIDDYTLQIELINPEPNLLYFLAMTFTTPVPIELIKKYNNDLSRVVMGTGPYIYKGFQNNHYKLVRNKNARLEYYPTVGDRYANTQSLLDSSKERLPFIDEIYFLIDNQEESRWINFLEGKIDIINLPKRYLSRITDPNSEISTRLEQKKIKALHFSRQTSRWIGFGMNDPIIGKNLNLRKAIAFAIDKDEYVKVLTNNTNLKANSIFNPSIPGYRPAQQISYKFNLDKAKEYLKKSGIDLEKFKIKYSTRGKQEIHFEEAKLIKAQLAKIGLKVEVEFLEFSEFLKKGRAGELQFWTDNWIYDYPDAENVLQLLISSNHPGINKSAYSNPKVDHLYKVLSRTIDKDKRYELMYEIEKVVEQDLPWIMLMYESTYIVQQKDIKNYRKSFFIRNHLKYLKSE